MLDPDPVAHHTTGPTGVYTMPPPLLPPASDEPISSKNPSPNRRDPELPPEPIVHVPAQGRIGDPTLAGDPIVPPMAPVRVVDVEPPERDEPIVGGNRGATTLSTSISATACALAFLVHLYSYFSLNMIVLIRVISASIS